MDARSAAIGTTAFASVPVTVGGVVPWLVGASARDSWTTSTPGTVAGWLLVALGVAGLAAAFVRFARDGLGTPSPTAPTEHLVVTGPLSRTAYALGLAAHPAAEATPCTGCRRAEGVRRATPGVRVGCAP